MLFEYLLRWCYTKGFVKGRLLSEGFHLPFLQDEIPGEISIGRIIDTDFVYKVGVEDMTKSVFIAGVPGSGKTQTALNILAQLVQKGIKVIVIDPKGAGDFDSLIPYGVISLKWHNLLFNILNPPENYQLNSWLQKIAEALSESLGLLVASMGELVNYMMKTFQHYEGKQYPCFMELASEILFDKGKTYKQETYRSTIANRMATVTHALARVFHCRRGFMDEIMKHSVIIDISDLIGVAQQTLVECILAYVFCWHSANVPKVREQKLVRFMAFEEAQHTILNIAKSRGARPASTGIEQAIALSRERGLGFASISQSPSKMLPEAINDAHLRISFNLGAGQEIRILGHATGLNKEQAEMIQHLGVGMAIMQRNSGFTLPSIVQCFQAGLPDPTEEDYRRNQEQVNRLRILGEPCMPEEGNLSGMVEQRLPENAKKLLLTIGEKPADVTMGFYKRSGLAGETGNKAKAQLLKEGLIEEYDVPGAGSGKTKSASLTPEGIRTYERITRKKPNQLYRTQWAGLPHDFWVNKVAAYFHHRGHQYRIAEKLGNQEADIIIVADGEKSAYEVTLTLTNAHKKIDMLKHVDRVVFLYTNENQHREIKKLAMVPKDLQDRVAFMPLKSFLL